MSQTAATREIRIRSALKLFFYALTLALAIVAFVFAWERLIGTVSGLAFDVAYALVLVCLLVCLLAMLRLFVAHLGRASDAT